MLKLCLLGLVALFATGESLPLARLSKAMLDNGVTSSIGDITIIEGGQKVTRHIVGNGGAWISNGNALTLQHGARTYIANKASDSFYPELFQWYYFAGKNMSFDVTLSGVGCSCNAALYFVSMPGHNSDGSAAPGAGGDYYCDANDVGGVYCWEMDVMEANKYVTQTTPHNCNSAPQSYISWCDGGGCATNSHNVNGNGMGPGGQYIIDTTKWFHYEIYFGDDETMKVTMEQSGKTFSYDACNDAGYRNTHQTALKAGYVVTMSLWGSDYNTMSWLDGNTGCWGDCDQSGTVTFSNIRVA